MHAPSTLSAKQIQHLRHTIMQWQTQHGRHDLPWQQSPSAYSVHVSEIMLQQTQVSTVIPYFERWMQRFPSLDALASASEDDVMAQWQGLGYYSRARNLRKAAAHVIAEHGGEYPDCLQALQAIPGVGRYTAGAIRSFALQQYGPIVDGNVKRLYARLFGIDGEPNSSAFNRTLWQLAEQLTPHNASHIYSQGVLDLGATVCTKSQPKCSECPVQSECVAHATGRIEQLPNPKKKREKPFRVGHFSWHQPNQHIHLVKRSSPGIWGGLWCLPELPDAPKDAELAGEFIHQFTHYTLHAKVWRASTPQHLSVKDDNSVGYLATQLFDLNQLDQTGLPTPIKQFIQDRIALKRHT
ncbi:A/G-specific adenine glycosylase [Aliidiomarina maris]|uniref:Adenine DNA glycosylase n=2 Tax=Aliidiomarina maris TaxID=531312 RepID=A0ABY0BQ01_9GAMM|nr:A/G-specific adenine glycosylase [Aliidiomarina maris]RUO21076.1 A/G-specific adenine glycosylase [Aliidiomarina maris]